MSWMPRKLAPSVRVVLSMIPDTPQYKALTRREPMPSLLRATPLDEKSKTVCVFHLLFIPAYFENEIVFCTYKNGNFFYEMFLQFVMYLVIICLISYYISLISLNLRFNY